MMPARGCSRENNRNLARTNLNNDFRIVRNHRNYNFNYQKNADLAMQGIDRLLQSYITIQQLSVTHQELPNYLFGLSTIDSTAFSMMHLVK
jgi:hypothetical protein